MSPIKPVILEEGGQKISKGQRATDENKRLQNLYDFSTNHHVFMPSFCLSATTWKQRRSQIKWPFFLSHCDKNVNLRRRKKTTTIRNLSLRGLKNPRGKSHSKSWLPSILKKTHSIIIVLFQLLYFLFTRILVFEDKKNEWLNRWIKKDIKKIGNADHLHPSWWKTTFLLIWFTFKETNAILKIILVYIMSFSIKRNGLHH